MTFIKQTHTVDFGDGAFEAGSLESMPTEKLLSTFHELEAHGFKTRDGFLADPANLLEAIRLRVGCRLLALGLEVAPVYRANSGAFAAALMRYSDGVATMRRMDDGREYEITANELAKCYTLAEGR